MPSRRWDAVRERIASSVTSPPALRMMWASPRSRPSIENRSMRVSMQARTATLRRGRGSRSGAASASVRAAAVSSISSAFAMRARIVGTSGPIAGRRPAGPPRASPPVPPRRRASGPPTVSCLVRAPSGAQLGPRHRNGADPCGGAPYRRRLQLRRALTHLFRCELRKRLRASPCEYLLREDLLGIGRRARAHSTYGTAPTAPRAYQAAERKGQGPHRGRECKHASNAPVRG